MFLARFRIVALAMAATAVTAFGYQGSSSTGQWPPPVQKGPDGSPALSPAEALKTFSMPPGYHLELVASEPLVQDPIVDRLGSAGPALGRSRCPGSCPTSQRAGAVHGADRQGRRARRHRTTTATMDKRTVFADGLILARALKVLDHGVLVAEPPNAWLMHDTNGDLRMDTKELVTDQYGRREARVEQNANDFEWGLDNWMHTADSDIYMRFKNGKFEVQKTLSRGEWGATHDDAGRIYRNTNESSVHVDFVPTPYFARNPNLLRTRGSYEALRDDENLVNVVWPARPNPGTNRAYQLGIDRPDGTLVHFTSVCAPRIYRGDRLPAELNGNVFVAEPAANLVSRIILNDDGTTLRARKAYDKGEFLAVDRRALPPRLSVQRARRHALHRRHVPRRHPAAGRHHGVPARSHPHATSWSSRQGSAASTASCTRRRAATRKRHVGTARRRSWSRRSRIRMAGGATPRSGCWSNVATRRWSPDLAKLASTAHRLASASARAVDA